MRESSYLFRENDMKLKRCVCKRKVTLYSEPEGFIVSCPRCGKETPHFEHIEDAILEWNREKSIRDIIKES